MLRLRLLAVATLLVVSSICVAGDDPTPPGHSTVNLVFVTKYSPQSLASSGTVPMIQVAGMVVPTDRLRPIEIEIDGEFVGHALVGPAAIKPVFILPEGKHEFKFSIAGSKPIYKQLNVLGTGSTQYLLINIPPESGGDDAEDAKKPETVSEKKESAEASDKPAERYIKYAQRIIQRYDKDGDDVLAESEWQNMIMSPRSADTNKNGSITIEEYASWMASRNKRE